MVVDWNRLSRDMAELLSLGTAKMWCLETWCSDGFGSTGITAVLNGLKGVFQLMIQLFYDDCRQQNFLAQLNIMRYYFQVL